MMGTRPERHAHGRRSATKEVRHGEYRFRQCNDLNFRTSPRTGRSKITHVAVGKEPEAVDLSPDGKEVWTGLNVEGWSK